MVRVGVVRSESSWCGMMYRQKILERLHSLRLAPASLEPKTILELRRAAELLRLYPDAKVIIEGHTDNTGSKELNIKLSRNRAQKGVAYMEIVEQISADRVEVIGYGPTRPIATNQTAEGRARNRRVEVKVEGVPEGVVSETVPELSIGDLKIPLEGARKLKVEFGKEQEVVLKSFIGQLYAIPITQARVQVIVPEREMIPGPKYPLPVTVIAPPGSFVSDPVTRHVVGPSGKLDFKMSLENVLNEFEISVVTPYGYVYNSKVDYETEMPSTLPDMAERYGKKDFLTITGPPRADPLRTQMARFFGQTVTNNTVVVNGEKVYVRPDGTFYVYVPVPPDGSFRLQVVATHPDGVRGEIDEAWNVKRQDFFYVGLADAKATWRRVERVTEEDPYPERVIGEGQAAFFLRGKILGKYLLTAQLDTGFDEVEGLVGELFEYSEPSDRTMIEADRYYPIYGDDSQRKDMAPSRSKYYARLEWDRNYVGYGSHTWSMQNSQLITDAKSVEGAQMYLQTATDETTHAWNSRVAATVSDIREAYAADKFVSTGGTLYYLSNDEVQEGSEYLEVLSFSRDTKMVISRKRLLRGIDYDIDYDSGRIWLSRPMGFSAVSHRLIRDELFDDNSYQLVVRYRYRPDLQQRALFHSEMIGQNFGDVVDVQAGVVQNRVDDIAASRANVIVSSTAISNTTVFVEGAYSKNQQASVNYSDDGGFTFDDITQPTGQSGAAAVAGIEHHSEVIDFSIRGEQIDHGFGADDSTLAPAVIGEDAAPRHMASGDVRRASASVGKQFDWLSVRGGYDLYQSRTDNSPTQAGRTDRRQAGTVGLSQQVGVLQFDQEVRVQRQTSLLSQDGHFHRADGALRATWWPLPETASVYAQHQHGISDLDDERRWISTIGGEVRLIRNLWVGLEADYGNHIAGVGASLRYQALARTQLYSSYKLSQRRSDRSISGAALIGGQQAVTDTVTLTAEQGINHAEDINGQSSRVGGRWQAQPSLTLSSFYERGELRQDDGAVLARDAVGLSAGYNQGALSAALSSTYRRDRTDLDVDQVTGRANTRYKFSESLSALASAEGSRSWTQDDPDFARFHELGLGLALRPIGKNVMNMLLGVRSIRELLPPSFDEDRVEIDATIGSAEAVVAFPFRTEVGLKSALKRSEFLSGAAEGIDLTTGLYIGGLGVRLLDPFYLWGEYRLLRQYETDINVHGPAAEFGWSPEDFVYAAIGYNFSRVDDRLSAYETLDAEGIYVRVRGQF